MRARTPDPNHHSSRPGDRSNVERGRWGEQRAAAEYRRRGYRIVDANWRTSSGEIDLIVERDGIIVFSEVKARRTDRYGPAASAVGPQKQHRIRRLAAEWLERHGPHRRGIRFDVVAITGVRIEVIEAAF